MEITKPGRESCVAVPDIQILMNTGRRFEHSLDNTAYKNNNKSKTKTKTSLKKREVKTSNSPPVPAIHNYRQWLIKTIKLHKAAQLSK